MACRVLGRRYEYANLQSQPEERRVCEANTGSCPPFGTLALWPAGGRDRGVLSSLWRRVDLFIATDLTRASALV